MSSFLTVFTILQPTRFCSLSAHFCWTMKYCQTKAKTLVAWCKSATPGYRGAVYFRA